MVSLFDSKTAFWRALPPPDFRRSFFFFLALGVLLFLRPPHTNFIYDEQEALLANPYLLGDVPLLDVLRVDFWGRPPPTTIGSYRPLPNMLWRSLSWSLSWNTPFVLCLLNVLVHALCAALLCRFLSKLLVGPPAELEPVQRMGVWSGATFFAVCALSTEAVSGVVGLCDLLVCAFSLVGLLSVVGASRRLTAGRAMIRMGAVFVSVFLGLMSKESMLASVPLLALSPFFLGERLSRRQAWFRAVLVACVSVVAVVVQVAIRKDFFPGNPANMGPLVSGGPGEGLVGAFFHWLSPPTLPADAFNNPLLEAAFSERLVTGLHVFASQLLQSLLPFHLSGDWSFPRQLVANWGAMSGLGAFILAASLFAMTRLLSVRRVNSATRLVSAGLSLLTFSYLPVSNILVALPTVRAARLFYVPTLGLALILCGVFLGGAKRWTRSPRIFLRAWGFFLAFQVIQARAHATHYISDLSYWRATAVGAPASAKAHLNLGVMVGARGDLDARLIQTKRAVELAPDWGMGRIYLGDTHCRRGEFDLAMREYKKGLERSANSKALTALALQCLWDGGVYSTYAEELGLIGAQHPDSWLDYFLFQLDNFGEENRGIPPKYRPRHYNRRRPVATK